MAECVSSPNQSVASDLSASLQVDMEAVKQVVFFLTFFMMIKVILEQFWEFLLFDLQQPMQVCQSYQKLVAIFLG